jgi:hypothetical protein
MPTNISDKPSGNRSRFDWRVRFKFAFMTSITPSEVIAQTFVLGAHALSQMNWAFGSVSC